MMETNLIQSDRTIKTWDVRDHRKISSKNISVFRDGCRTAATSKIERSVIIVNGWKPNYYHKALHLGSCSSPRSTSGFALSFGCLTSHNLALFEISYLPRLLEATGVCNTYHITSFVTQTRCKFLVSKSSKLVWQIEIKLRNLQSAIVTWNKFYV